MTFLYSQEAIKSLEASLIQNQRCTEYDLMSRAGHALWTILQEYWPNARKVAIFCGKGNNGGDGYELARLAHEARHQVTVYALTPIESLSGPALQAATLARQAGVNILPYCDSCQISADIIIDALLGTGLRDAVTGEALAAVMQINNSHCPVLAVDIPSGLATNTGQVMGVAVQADVTVTFIALKQGLYTNKAPAFTGKIICNSLGITANELATVAPAAELLSQATILPWFPERLRYAHKGDHGHVLVIGGDYGMGGAVRMAAEAALRAGAGLVTVATRPEHIGVVSGSRPELMCHQISEHESLQPLLARATVVVIGPGLGKTRWAQHLLTEVLASQLPLVIDADGLNLLAEHPQQRASWILTPHPGEAGRLLQCSCQTVQDDRYRAAMMLQQRYGGVIVLKGLGTIIKTDANRWPKVCTAGNPGMATAGMGDVLSGILGGLIAQKLSLQQAAEAGVLIHAMAGDQAAIDGGERGLLATDLLPHIRELVNNPTQASHTQSL